MCFFRLLEFIVNIETKSGKIVQARELDLNREIGSIADIQNAYYKLLSICTPGISFLPYWCTKYVEVYGLQASQVNLPLKHNLMT